MPKVKLFDENKILEKAMELFWKRGYHATSIQDLVNYLGLSRSSIYDTYGGKKELFDKSFQLYRIKNTKGINDFLKSQNSVINGIRKLFEMAIDESVSDLDRKGCFVVNTTTELVPGDNEMQQILKENKTIFENIFYLYLKSGQEKGEIPQGKNLKAIAGLIFTLYNGIKVIAKIEMNKKDMIKSIDELLSLLR